MLEGQLENVLEGQLELPVLLDSMLSNQPMPNQIFLMGKGQAEQMCWMEPICNGQGLGADNVLDGTFKDVLLQQSFRTFSFLYIMLTVLIM